MQANQEIRRLIMKKRLRHYEIAAVLGISEYTFCKWLRCELSPDRELQVMEAIESLVRQQNKATEER